MAYHDRIAEGMTTGSRRDGQQATAIPRSEDVAAACIQGLAMAVRQAEARVESTFAALERAEGTSAEATEVAAYECASCRCDGVHDAIDALPPSMREAVMRAIEGHPGVD